MTANFDAGTYTSITGNGRPFSGASLPMRTLGGVHRQRRGVQFNVAAKNHRRWRNFGTGSLLPYLAHGCSATTVEQLAGTVGGLVRFFVTAQTYRAAAARP